jgi:hypothetical protein
LIDGIHLCAEILGEHGTRADGQKFEDDGRASEDMVPESEDQVEVRLYYTISQTSSFVVRKKPTKKIFLVVIDNIQLPIRAQCYV